MMSLTLEEERWLTMVAEVWNQLCRLIPEGPTRSNDLGEAIHHIHSLQHMVMANSAARAQPRRYRLLGQALHNDQEPERLRPLPSITPRERMVGDLLVSGRTVPEIAEDLKLGQSTIKTHVTKLYQKFGVTNRVQFIMEYRR